MLPKKKRLSREEFNQFFSIGLKKHTPYCMVVSSPSPTFHASVVVSKKVAKTAVQRNKIRRRIYDILRNHQKEKETTGVYVFITKPPIKEQTFTELKRSILEIIT